MIMGLWERIITVFSSFKIYDFLDICLVAILIYSLIKIIRETRAVQLLKAVLLLGVVYVGIRALKMQMSIYLFNLLVSNFILVFIVLFQPEIRHALESMGRSKLSDFGFTKFGNKGNEAQQEEMKHSILDTVKAISDMSEHNVGAIIVFEKETPLGDIAATGTILDAEISRELVGNIFFPNSPLHDGAMIIREGRALAAGCILPLTDDSRLSSELGTRHRAGIGVTERSDAIVAIVSEETGHISLAQKGSLRIDISDSELREELLKILINTKTKNKKREQKKPAKQKNNAD